MKHFLLVLLVFALFTSAHAVVIDISGADYTNIDDDEFRLEDVVVLGKDYWGEFIWAGMAFNPTAYGPQPPPPPGWDEDFEDGVADGFVTVTGTWTVVAGGRAYCLEGTGGTGGVWNETYYGGAMFADFDQSCYATKQSGNTYYSYGMPFRYNSSSDLLILQSDDTGYWMMWKMVGGSTYIMYGWVTSPDLNTGFGSWNKYQVVAVGYNYEVYFNDSYQITLYDYSPYGPEEGYPGAMYYTLDATDVLNYDDFVLSNLTDGYVFKGEPVPAWNIPATEEQVAKSQ